MSTPAATLPTAPKSGFMSSEFAMTMLTIVGLAIPGIPQQYHPLMMAMAGVYVAARTLLKSVHALGYAQSIPDLPALPAININTTTTPQA